MHFGKPFITDKGHCTSKDYMLEENEALINLFNDFFFNIIEHGTVKTLTTSSKDESLEEIVSTYKDHSKQKNL